MAGKGTENKPVDPFREGQEAFHKGIKWHENPYESGSVYAGLWDNGHTSQRAPHLKPSQGWAGNLSEDQLILALHELRRRGYVIAAYNAHALAQLFIGEDFKQDPADWLDENKDRLDSVMNDAAYDFIKKELIDQG